MNHRFATLSRTLAPLALVLAALGVPGAANAADGAITIKDKTLVTDMAGYRVTMPLPDWNDGRSGADALAEANVARKAKPDAELVEIFPPGSSADGWTQRYAAFASVHANARGEHILNTVSSFRQVCEPDALSFQTTPAANPQLQEITLVVCGHFVDGVVGAAFQGKGEVMLVVVPGDATAAVKVSHEWLGPAFSIGDPGTWPVSEKVLTARGLALQSMTRLEKLK